MLKNYMEDVVEHILLSMLKSFPDICTCEQCMLDIKAITLNNLKPHYVVTQEGEVYSRVNEMYLQFETDVIRSIIQAIDIVSNNKRHR